MSENSPLSNRKNIRLKDFDYSSPGYYFVTICTENRECSLGDIQNGQVELNALGRTIHSAWTQLPQSYTGVNIDEFVVMPNHLHGIVILNVGATFMAPKNRASANPAGVINHAPTLGEIIRRFKAISSRVIRQKGNKDFAWQRNYHEHVIRSDGSLDNIREYIVQNPLKWAEDENNPQNKNYLGEPKIRPYN